MRTEGKCSTTALTHPLWLLYRTAGVRGTPPAQQSSSLTSKLSSDMFSQRDDCIPKLLLGLDLKSFPVDCMAQVCALSRKWDMKVENNYHF